MSTRTRVLAPMQNMTLILLLAGMAAIAFYMGRSRSLAVVGGPAHGSRLHSLPGYYGYFTLIWCLLPGVSSIAGTDSGSATSSMIGIPSLFVMLGKSSEAFELDSI